MEDAESMRKNHRPPGAEGTSQSASDWLVRRHAGWEPGEEAAFQAWLAEDPRHAAAFAALERTWAELNQPRARGYGHVASQQLVRRRRRRDRQRKLSLGVSFGLAALALGWFWRSSPENAPVAAAAAEATVMWRPDRQLLPDGSTMEVNAAADLLIDYTPELRTVHLRRGEALFKVASDPARPFVVKAGEVMVRAVGTAFSVRRDSDRIDVLVTEGQVRVEKVYNTQTTSALPTEEAAPLLLAAGKKVVVSTDPVASAIPEVHTVTPTDIEQALAWRHQRVEFTGTPLSAALELFNQKNDVRLVAHDQETGQLQISGIFWTDDPEAFVRLVETGLYLRAERSGDRVVLRRK